MLEQSEFSFLFCWDTKSVINAGSMSLRILDISELFDCFCQPRAIPRSREMYLEEHFKGLKDTHPCQFIHVEIRDILLTDPPVHYQNENKPTNQGPLWIFQPLLARRKTCLFWKVQSMLA